VYNELGLDASKVSPDFVTKKLKTIDDSLSEGFDIFIIMSILAEKSERARTEISRKMFSSETDQNCYDFFLTNTGRIEVAWKTELQRVYFPIPPVCRFLTEKSRNSLVWEVNRENPNGKITDFISRSEGLVDEMEHLEKYSSNRLFSFFAK
jgi:hypothetical protein